METKKVVMAIIEIFIYISVLSFVCYLGYRNGVNDGSIKTCSKIGYVYLSDGNCVDKMEYQKMTMTNDMNEKQNMPKFRQYGE